MTFSFKPLRFLFLALASATLLAACGGGDDDDLDDRADLADPKVRFVHAVPGGPAVTLVRNNVAESNATSVDYKYGSQYYDVGTAVQSFSLRVAATNTEVATVSLDARRGNKYTLVALPTTSGVELRVIDDPYNKSPTSDDARVRVLNASANATTFDVYLTAPAADLTPVTPTMAAVSYLSAVPTSGADSVQIEGSTYQLRIAPAGSKTPFFSNATLSIPTNADWLFITLPDDASPLTPNAIRVLLVRSDNTGDATDEILAQP